MKRNLAIEAELCAAEVLASREPNGAWLAAAHLHHAAKIWFYLGERHLSERFATKAGELLRSMRRAAA